MNKDSFESQSRLLPRKRRSFLDFFRKTSSTIKRYIVLYIIHLLNLMSWFLMPVIFFEDRMAIVEGVKYVEYVIRK